MDGNNFHPGYQPYPQSAHQNLAPQASAQQQHPSSTQHQQQQNSLASFGSLSAQSQQSQQQHAQPSPSHTTLPPLQGQNGYSQYGSMSYTHPGSQSATPTTPHTPASASVTGNPPSNYQQHVSPATTGPGSMLPPSYPGLAYNGALSHSMMYPSSTATSMPPSSSAVGLPTIRPMPPGGVSTSNGLPSLVGAPHMGIGQQSAFMQHEDQPTHVVGSQGRRGILPSAPGRPNPPPQGTSGATKSMIPQKDADGKYPCPHCNKTYLHAKHLKRHLLRHTGDRPYMCHLCKDTFSRSDILKRHFQKCSLRRGNPTGANHLAHQRRNTNNGNRLSISQQDGSVGLGGILDASGSAAYNGNPPVNGDMSARSSRANSLITAGTMSHRNSLAGLGILGSTASSSEQINQTTAPYQPGMNAYSMQNLTNGAQMPNYSFNQPQHLTGNSFSGSQPQQQQMSFLGHQSSQFENNQENNQHQMQNGDGSGVDWNRMFTQGGQDGYIGSQTANASSQGTQLMKTEIHDKSEYHAPNDFANESFLGSLYSHPGCSGGEDMDGFAGLPIWNMSDPLQAKVDSLMQHCFPNGLKSVRGSPAAELMQSVLKMENIKHFAEQYTSYHGHWPIVHLPTFKLSEADNNFVLAMICIGAVYSPRLTVDQVRLMMEFVKETVHAKCTIYSRYHLGLTEGLGGRWFEVEEFQALTMLHILFTWHGDPAQRQAARSEFPILVRIARAMDLCHAAPPDHYAHSPLHFARSSLSNLRLANWDWQGWLEQEKRNRSLYQLLIMDAAMVIYFNCTPEFDPLEIHLSLPADDAAWDASNGQECADALGLNGTHAQSRNVNGTRKMVQPSMHDAMRTLLDPHASFEPGATNVYSKFLLIHTLILRVIVCQKAIVLPDAKVHGYSLNVGSNSPVTPLSQNDWLEQHGGGGSGRISTTNSGRVTPTETASLQNQKKQLGQALEKWKRNWDYDMDVQYPPSQSHLRRFGFSRDGVHFFYLGRSFLHSFPATEFTWPADLRFKRVMALLKRIKGVVIGDNETKGQEIGSVGDIDDQYGLDSLTLDMKLLFKPHNSPLDSPAGVVKAS